MHARGRVAALAAAVAMMVMLAPSAAFAVDEDGLQECIDQAEFHDGELPVCTEVDGEWIPSWPDEIGSGIPSEFVFWSVLVVLVGVAILVWKVSTARRLAAQSGMDPGLATQMTLLTDSGLEATYVASSLREPRSVPSDPGAERAPAAERLTELKSLLDAGLITQAEYDQRRGAIIDGL